MNNQMIIKLKPNKISFATSEAIKMLRANIQFSGYKIKAVSVISFHPNEGKSFISYELALSLAEQGKKTIYVDCDLRKSVMQARLKISTHLSNLTEYLCGNKTADEIIYDTENPCLSMIFAGIGSPNPSELLSEDLFDELCAKLKDEYDYIVFDTTPIGSVIDGAIVSQKCNGTVIVIESGGTDRSDAIRMKNQLETANANVLGVVVNKVGIGNSGYYYPYYKKHGYGYYGKHHKGRYGYGQYGRYGYGQYGNNGRKGV